jgi:4-aminobutyrate aminotransferase-like enzyme
MEPIDSLHPRWLRLLAESGLASEFTRGSGSHLYDAQGRAVLDFCGGYGAVSVGHFHPKAVTAIAEFLSSGRPALTAIGVPQVSQVLAHRAVAYACVPDHVVLFGGTGSEAIEIAIRACIAGTRRGEIVCVHGGFHGVTQAARELSSPLFDGADEPIAGIKTIRVHINDAKQVEHVVQTGNVAAVLIEIIQASAGAAEWTLQGLGCVAAVCQRTQTPLIVDEIMTGFARTGSPFAFHRLDGLVPDVIVSGKALTAGLVPLALVMIRRDLYYKACDNGMPQTLLGSTFSLSALAATLALAVLDVICADTFCAHAAQAASALLQSLEGLADGGLIGDVRGKGLLIAFQPLMTGDQPDAWSAYDFCKGALSRGLVVTPAPHAADFVVLTPPLNIGFEEIEIFEQITRDSILEARATT